MCYKTGQFISSLHSHELFIEFFAVRIYSIFMPRVLKTGPYRIYFNSHEPNEPPHIHIDRDDIFAKFWLQPVHLARNVGFRPNELSKVETIIIQNQDILLERLGMGILAKTAEERVVDVHFTDDTISVDLMDGRTITVPLAWYPRLLNATPAQRNNWQKSGGGYGTHWPDIDEDLSTEGLLRGAPAPQIQLGKAK